MESRSRSPRRQSQIPGKIIPASGHDPVHVALTLRHEISEAVVWRREGKMLHLAKSMFKAPITVHALRESGLGLIASDASIWNGQAAEYARRSVEKWRGLCQNSKSKTEEGVFSLSAMQRNDPERAPFASHKGSAFVQFVDRLEAELVSNECDPAPTVQFRKLAVRLIMRGFSKLNTLNGLTCDGAVSLASNTWEQGVVSRAWEAQNAKAFRQRAAWARAQQQPAEAPPVGASTVVQRLKPLRDVAVWDKMLGALDVAPAVKSKPSKAVSLLQVAVEQGSDIMAELDQRAFLARVANLEPASLPALCSGVTCWHHFAVNLLHYPDSGSLPPHSDTHVSRFLAIFRCGTTGANYVYHVRNACRMFRVSEEWFTKSLVQQVSGAKKMHQKS